MASVCVVSNPVVPITSPVLVLAAKVACFSVADGTVKSNTMSEEVNTEGASSPITHSVCP